MEMPGEHQTDPSAGDTGAAGNNAGIVMSNYSELNITNQANQLGASYYLVKSDVEPSTVVQTVRDILKGK